jgi:prophage regulatory protein
MNAKWTQGDVRMVRRPEARAITGDSNTQLYEKIKCGLMVRPVPIGGRAVAFPSDELRAIVQARAAGLSDAELKGLVASLHERRGRLRVALLSDLGGQ